jgi:osmoprotectant transport system ATP-binding protein
VSERAEAGADAPAVAIRGASVAAEDGRLILEPLSLDVYRGETLVLLGRSGSGKTTTLKLINALRRPTSGEVWVEGRPVGEWEPHRLRRRIGWVIQEIGLFPHYTVAENVAVVPRLESWEPDRVGRRVTELLHLVGLEPDRFAGRYPHELSGGQRQRVGLARALAADPPLLLLDEPFGALDPVTRGEMVEAFAALSARLSKTVVFVTHDVREAVRLASRVAFFEAGRLLYAGQVDALLSSGEPAVAAFTAALRR